MVQLLDMFPGAGIIIYTLGLGQARVLAWRSYRLVLSKLDLEPPKRERK